MTVDQYNVVIEAAEGHVRVVRNGAGFCAICGVRFPCLIANEAAVERGRLRNEAEACR